MIRARLAGIVAFAFVLISAAQAAPPSEVKALFREGQTFLTWKEDGAAKGEVYRVYRHTAPITAANLADAKMIAEVREGSSRFEEMCTRDGKGLLTGRDNAPPPHVIPRLCIEPVADDNKPNMLPEDSGLLVWTVKEGEQDSYYAVTTAAGGAEDKAVGAGNTCGPVKEKKEPIGALLYYVDSSPTRPATEAQQRIDKAKAEDKAPDPNDLKRKDEKSHRDWYIMWMDHELWNVDYVGYALPFAISRESFKEAGPTPSAHLDGIGTMNVFTANYTNYGCGDFARNALPTWYFGYGTKVKDRADGTNVKQEIANYVQYRILQTVLWARRKYKITDPRFLINGHSMGASGAIGFALQYPKFVTAIWANEGLTKYDYIIKKADDKINMWQSSTWGNYGDPKLKNPVRFLPFGDPQMDWVLKYNGWNIYDIRDAAKFMAANVGEDLPLLVIGHCFQDGSIPYYSQAEPFEKYIKDSRHCFSYALAAGSHGWGSAWGNGNMTSLVRWDESRPGFSNVPPITGWRYNKKDETSRTYMYKVAWGVKAKPISGKAVEETETSWSLPIIHLAKEGEEEDYAVDVTPRNLQKLKVVEGDVFTYEIKTLDGAKVESSGETTADAHNLLLIPKVPIRKSGALVEVKLKNRGPKFAEKFPQK